MSFGENTRTLCKYCRVSTHSSKTCTVCQLCQNTEHRTNMCPNLFCQNCKNYGHVKHFCQNLVLPTKNVEIVTLDDESPRGGEKDEGGHKIESLCQPIVSMANLLLDPASNVYDWYQPQYIPAPTSNISGQLLKGQVPTYLDSPPPTRGVTYKYDEKEETLRWKNENERFKRKRHGKMRDRNGRRGRSESRRRSREKIGKIKNHED